MEDHKERMNISLFVFLIYDWKIKFIAILGTFILSIYNIWNAPAFLTAKISYIIKPQVKRLKTMPFYCSIHIATLDSGSIF